LVPFLALAKNDVDSIPIANDALPSSTVNSLPDHGLHPVEKKTGNLIITLKLSFKMSLNTHKNKKFYWIPKISKMELYLIVTPKSRLENRFVLGVSKNEKSS